MVMHHRAESAKPVDRRWHNGRIDARHHSFSLKEWGEVERVKYDLDTADIDGGMYNDRTYTVDRDLPANLDIRNGTDVRTLDDR